MEHSEVKVEVNATTSSTQVSPQDISVTLRPGRQQTSAESHIKAWICLLLVGNEVGRFLTELFHYGRVCVCTGSEASVIVAVKQLERYPVDLYYLVDVSASMQENLDHVGVVSLNKSKIRPKKIHFTLTTIFLVQVLKIVNTDNCCVFCDPSLSDYAACATGAE